MACEFTVFTPTYNRGKLIEKLYDSLSEQTYKSFEWLVVDNGNESIKEIILKLSQSADFKIRYVRNKVPGINRAFNKAIKIAEGKMFFKVDDDDYLTRDALEKLKKAFDNITSSQYAGVAGLRSDSEGNVNGGAWKVKGKDYIDATNLERKRYGLGGDKAECYFTKILKKYLPFPEFQGETYTDESIIYNRIAVDGYPIRWINEVIYISEYRKDGITLNLNKKLLENPKTYTYIVNQRLKIKSISLIYKAKMLLRYMENCRLNHERLEEVKRKVNLANFYIILCWYLCILTKYIPRKRI